MAQSKKHSADAQTAWQGYISDEDYVRTDARARRMRKNQRYSKNDERLGSDHAMEMARYDHKYPSY